MPGLLLWSADAPPVAELEARGAQVVEWRRWRSEAAAWLRSSSSGRRSLDPPARARIDALLTHDAVAVLDVRLGSLDDVRCLHETLLVPVLRAGVPLLVECSQEPDELDVGQFVGIGLRARAHPRADAVAMRTRPRRGHAARPRCRRPPHRPLDETQLAAARAPGGVVQVIAPAGSGKTTVLIERVRELLARGGDARADPVHDVQRRRRVELRERLSLAGVQGVAARTFHSVGHQIIRKHGIVDGRTLHAEGWTVPQWARFARLAASEVGAPVPEAAELPNEISAIRLGRLVTAEEWERESPRDERSRCIARVYSLVEEEKDAPGALRLRRHDRPRGASAAYRASASGSAGNRSFEHVLVDEYQDIEPAQELLVRMLAAPHDDLFVVGDEDQTLYGWRRASVHRMIDLDAAYPALRRVALEHNYRCTPEAIAASASLIAHNRLRFAKADQARGGRAAGRSARDPPRALRGHRRRRATARAQARGVHAGGHRRPRSHGQRPAAVRARRRGGRRPHLRPRRALRRGRGAGDARGLLRGLERSGAGDRSRRARDPAAPVARAWPGRGRTDLPRIECRRFAAGGDRAPAGQRQRAVARREGGGGLVRARGDRGCRGADRATPRRRARPALRRRRARVRSPRPRRPDGARRRRARGRRQDRGRVRRGARRPAAGAARARDDRNGIELDDGASREGPAVAARRGRRVR